MGALKPGDWRKEQLRRVALAIYKGLEADDKKTGRKRTNRQRLNAAFAIATKHLQRHGYLKPGTAMPTAKGRKRAAQKLLDAQAGQKYRTYEEILASARKHPIPLPTVRQLRGAANKDVCQLLQPLRTAMDTVFSCKTTWGTCRPKIPAAGHCWLAALTVQDIFGGVILHGDVPTGQSGSSIPHYWNQIGTGKTPLQLDVTGDQFFRPPVQCKRGKNPLYKVKSLYQRARHERMGPKSSEPMKRYDIFRRRLAAELRKMNHPDWAAKLMVMK